MQADELLKPVTVKLALVELERAVHFAEQRDRTEPRAEVEVRICFAAREAFQTFMDAVSLSRQYKEGERSALERGLKLALDKVCDNKAICESIESKLKQIQVAALKQYIDRV